MEYLVHSILDFIYTSGSKHVDNHRTNCSWVADGLLQPSWTHILRYVVNG